MENISLEDLYATKRILENKLDDYFGGEQKHNGDRGYQDILSDLSDIEEQIEELENKK